VTALTLSFVIPCLNESATIRAVIADCELGGQALGEPYEIVVADNGSTDGSREIAAASGARVIPVAQRGYGAALIAGIQAAEGTYVLMGDADSTYNFQQAPAFVAKLREGHDLVMGNRFKGTIARGAMPFLHRYLGNPVLSSLGRLFFGITVSDFHCGLRAFNREAINSLNLHCMGMEFASEMVIKACLMDLSTAEIPTDLRINPPGRVPHLNTWRDGWRHLKFMLSYAPKYNFLPIAFFLILLASLLSSFYVTQTVPFTGPNTLVFSVSCIIASVSILSDYLLTREMIYSQYSRRKSRMSVVFDKFLGLNQGTDRLFALSGISFLISLFSFGLLFIYAARGLLSLPRSGISGLVACSSILISITIYMTAAKITSYRSLHLVKYSKQGCS